MNLEQNILGSIISGYEDLGDAANILTSAMFEKPAHQAIFSACLKLYDQGKTIDLIAVNAALQGNDIYQKAGGAGYLAEVAQAIGGRLCEHALVLKERFVKRKALEMAKNIHRACTDQQPLDDILGLINTSTDEISGLLIDKNKSLPASAVIMKSLEQLEARTARAKNGDHLGIPTGLTKLDQLTNGWKGNQLIVLAARPGQGKTQLAIHFALTAAAHSFSCIFFSLEMTSTALMDRALISMSKVSSEDYRAGKLTQAAWDKITQAGSHIQQMPITINDAPLQTVRKIRTECLLLKRTQRLDMVIIDYLQLIEPEDRHQIREQQVAIMTRALKLLAKELGVPVILLCQLNREAENNQGKRPSLANLRESGAIEQDADLVLLLLRPEAYGIKTIDIGEQIGVSTAGLGLLDIAKQRDGATGPILFISNKQFSEIKDYQP
ncbi:MAG: DnaB-like helicase C-terminal domain-containing protein [Candidatus Paceibacterota bacterium]